MAEGGYRHLPIVDDAGQPKGVVAVHGIVHYLVDHFPETVYNLPPNPNDSTRERSDRRREPVQDSAALRPQQQGATLSRGITTPTIRIETHLDGRWQPIDQHGDRHDRLAAGERSSLTPNILGAATGVEE